MTAAEMEAYVRARLVKFPLEQCGDEEGWLPCYKLHKSNTDWTHHKDYDEAIQAAYYFTLQREREIAEVEEEIEWVRKADNMMFSIHKSTQAKMRTLTRLQAIRAELGKGMKNG